MAKRGAIAPEGDAVRLSGLLLAAALAHAGLIALVAWTEQGDGTAGSTAGVEIPVEMASQAEADGRPETQRPSSSPTPPAAVEPREEARPETREPAARPQAQPQTQTTARPPDGKILELPKETDQQQASGKRGSDAKPDARPEDNSNPFGGLTAVEKPAAAEPTPTFLSSQAMTAPTRPRPPSDPKNDNYRAQVLGKVAANMSDPERPRPKALTIVGFRLDAQGGLESIWIARPSGHADLDAEAVDMVRRSAPFPPPPAGAERNFGAAIAFGGD